MSAIETAIKEFCDEYDYDFRDDYSGRCMYGKTCIGIVGGDIDVIYTQLNDYLNNNGYDDIINKLGFPRVDNMGLNYIVYFPHLRS